MQEDQLHTNKDQLLQQLMTVAKQLPAEQIAEISKWNTVQDLTKANRSELAKSFCRCSSTSAA